MKTRKDPNSPLYLCDHPRPVTRRQLLGQGFIGGLGMVMAPTLLGMLGNRTANAQTFVCQIRAGAGLVPFICLDLAGGANIAGSNVLVGGPGGQLDLLTAEGYSKLGLPSSMTPGNVNQVNTEFGLAFHADSAFLRGMQSKTSTTTRANVNGTIFCARSDNDTGNNPHNPMYGIAKCGANGSLVTLVGTDPSDSGGNSAAPMAQIDPTVRPTKVDSASDATGLVDTGKLVSLLNQTQAGQVAKAAEDITALKLQKIAEDPNLEELVHCGYVQTTDLISKFGNPDVVNPNLDTDIVGTGTSIFTAADMNQSRIQKTAAVMKLVINGYAGAGTVENGGYDYHDSTRATGEDRDFQAGQMMGAMLEYAARKATPLMLYVITDGALSSNGMIDNSAGGRGKGQWTGDNSDTAATFVLVYSPTGRPAMTTATAHQIGYYRPTAAVETAATPIANNVTLLAEAVILNYLALHNRVGDFASVLPMNGLGSTLDPLVAFAPIV
ncbi:MAG TPA: hypothetical protein VMR50_02965 [Myxococcota bacterium]|nr:hypothetical protein [Myxococcota bacterium]